MKDIVRELESINFEIAKLNLRKIEIECVLSQLLNHPSDCSKTYSIDEYKCTVTSGWNYSVDKQAYCSINIPEEINPIESKVVVSVNQRKLKKFEEEHGSLFAEFITKTPKKIHVKVTQNV